MYSKKIIFAILLLCAAVMPVWGRGFFDVVYATEVQQSFDPDLGGTLNDAPTYGVLFGYDTQIMNTGLFFDIELGYEMSTHEIDGAPSSYTYRNHRGMLGIRLKYGGWGYIEPFVCGGVIPYGYYEASDDLATAGGSDLEIEKNMSGSYFGFGVDIFFSKEGTFALGIEQRTIAFTVEDEDGINSYDAEAKRTAIRLSVLF